MHDNLVVSVAAPSRARTDILRAEPAHQAAREVVRGHPGSGAVRPLVAWVSSGACLRQRRRSCLAGGLGGCHLSGLVWETAWRGKGSIVAPGAWKWPAGIVPAARRRLGLLAGVSGAEFVAAAGITAAAVRRWLCGLWSAMGWRAAG